MVNNYFVIFSLRVKNPIACTSVSIYIFMKMTTISEDNYCKFAFTKTAIPCMRKG